MILATELNTYELLMADPQLQKHFAWVAKQKIVVQPAGKRKWV